MNKPKKQSASACASGNRAAAVVLGPLGLAINPEVLAKKKLAAPKCWKDLIPSHMDTPLHALMPPVADIKFSGYDRKKIRLEGGTQVVHSAPGKGSAGRSEVTTQGSRRIDRTGRVVRAFLGLSCRVQDDKLVIFMFGNDGFGFSEFVLWSAKPLPPKHRNQSTEGTRS